MHQPDTQTVHEIVEFLVPLMQEEETRRAWVALVLDNQPGGVRRSTMPEHRRMRRARLSWVDRLWRDRAGQASLVALLEVVYPNQSAAQQSRLDTLLSR